MPKIIMHVVHKKIGFKKKLAYMLVPYRYSTLSDADVIKMASDDSGITQSQIEQCLVALEKQLEQMLLNGHSIDLGPLGIMRFVIGGKAPENADDVTTDLVKRRRILLKPSKEFREAIKKVSIEVINELPNPAEP